MAHLSEGVPVPQIIETAFHNRALLNRIAGRPVQNDEQKAGEC